MVSCTPWPLYSGKENPQDGSGWVRKISPPQEFDLRTVQPVASRYTDNPIIIIIIIIIIYCN